MCWLISLRSKIKKLRNNDSNKQISEDDSDFLKFKKSSKKLIKMPDSDQQNYENSKGKQYKVNHWIEYEHQKEIRKRKIVKFDMKKDKKSKDQNDDMASFN